jgi:hypothetical protein
MNGNPFGGTPAAAKAPFFMPGYPCVQHKYFLDANCITTAHDCGNIMRIKYIFKDHSQIILPVGQYLLEFFQALFSHNIANYITTMILNRLLPKLHPRSGGLTF